MTEFADGAKIAITLVVLFFLVGTVLGLLMLVKNLTNSSANQLESGLNQLMSTTYDDYDQRIVSGTKVSTAVKMFSGEAVAVVVVTGLCQEANVNGGYCYGALLEGYSVTGTSGNYSYKSTAALTRNSGDTFFTSTQVSPITYNLNVKPLSVSGSQQFIRENGKFLAELIKDSTGTIIGVCFTQQST